MKSEMKQREVGKCLSGIRKVLIVLLADQMLKKVKDPKKKIDLKALLILKAQVLYINKSNHEKMVKSNQGPVYYY